jgi:chemotaxis protein MotB
MAEGKDWDELDLEAERPAAAKPPPIPGGVPAKKGRRALRLGWLLAMLFGAVGAALGGVALNGRVEEQAELAHSRDEAAQLRRRLFVTEDNLARENKTRVAEAAKAAQLEEELQQKGMEKQADSQVIDDLKAKLDEKDGDVSAEGRRIAVNFVDEILFPSGEAELSPHGKEVLSKVGGVLKGLADQQILVGGHTDDRPIHNEKFPSNWELSAARAVNVARYLVETVGVDPHRVVAAGYSEYHPRGTVRRQNRRIELLLTPTVEVQRK